METSSTTEEISETVKFLSEEAQETENRTLWQEFWLFLNISGPAVVCNVFSQAQWLISSSFAGTELGPEALAAISLTLLAALVVRSLMIGIHSGFETLVGNSFGEKNYSEIGFLMQTTFFLCAILVLPLWLFYFNIKGMLELLGQPPSVVELASEYLKIYSFIFPAETGYEIVRKFFQCQNVTVPFFYIKAIATVFHYIAVHTLKDVMPAFFLTEWLTFLLASQLYRFKLHNSETWPGWNFKEVFCWTRIKRILELGLPGVIALSEWWYYEFQTVLVGPLGTIPLAAHSIAYFVVPVAFHIPFGFATAAQTRVAVLMGERNSILAKKISLSTMALNACIGFSSASLAFIFRKSIFALFASNEDEELRLVNEIWPLVSIYMIFDSTLASAMGILRGLGKYALLAKIATLTLWVMGVPLLIVLVGKWKLWGLWLGNDIVYLIMSICFVFNLVKDSMYENHLNVKEVSSIEI